MGAPTNLFGRYSGADITMRRLFCWVFLVAVGVVAVLLLLWCFSGIFVTKYQWLSEGKYFEVDEEEYWIDRFAYVDKQGNVAASSLVISSYSDKFAGRGLQFVSVEHFRLYMPYREMSILTLHFDENEIIPTTDTLYFMQDGAISFEKKYQELDIVGSRLGANMQEAFDYLRPILESLIHEHVKSQEPEITHH